MAHKHMELIDFQAELELCQKRRRMRGVKQDENGAIKKTTRTTVKNWA